MTANVQRSCINLKTALSESDLDHVANFESSSFGKHVYRLLNLANVVNDAAALELCIPEKWAHLPWDQLHDGYQYLGLQKPLNLTLTDHPPPPPLERGALRVLYTSGRLSDPIDDDRVIAEFAERFDRRAAPQRTAIELTLEREVTVRRLTERLQTAHGNGKPFHIWHHTGTANPSAAGLTLALDDADLSPAVLQTLIQRFMLPNQAARLFFLHTPALDARLLPALGQLPVPCVIALNGSHPTLLRGVYMRLLKRDIGTASFLARLDRFIEAPQHSDWAALQVLSRTQPLRLVSESWHAQFTALQPTHEPARFLFLRANPVIEQHGQLPLDWELKFIKQALEYREGEYLMRDEGALERGEFIRHLTKMQPHLLHFSGHGTYPRGSLVWENHAGKGDFVRPEEIAQVLANFPELKCVVLNACYTAKLADLLREQGKVVIGMTSKVSDQSATYFAQTLYQTLAHGETLAVAFKLAQSRIELEGASEERDIPKITDLEAAARIRFFRREEFRGTV